MFDLHDGQPVKTLFIYKRYQGFYWTTKPINEILP